MAFPADTPPPAATPPRRIFPPVFLSALVFLAGWAVVFYVAHEEEKLQDNTPWGRSLILVQEESPMPGSQPILLRRLTSDEIPSPSMLERELLRELRGMSDGQELIDGLGLDRHEFFLLLDMAPDRWPELLASGRLPERGRAEILAGPLARFDRIEIGGTRFEVVGRIRDNIPGFGFAYVAPDHPDLRALAAESEELKRAWLVPDGFEAARAKELSLSAAEEGEDGEEAAPALVHPTALARRGWTVGLIAGLALMAFGGAGVQVGFLRRVGMGRLGRGLPVLADLSRWPGVLWALHFLYYGLFFCAMLLAMRYPLANLRLMGMIQNVLYRDDLSYVGEAYLSGNIPLAALMTFLHNFGYATFLLMFVPGTLVPVFGTLFALAKNALSFTLVGFGLSPMWIGSADGFTFHSITMVLELEAYIIAAFAVVAFLFNLGLGVMRNERGAVGRAFLVSLSGVAVVAIMLAVAALYEAVSLILLRFAV